MKTKFVYLSILLAFSLSGVNAAVPDCQSVVIGSGVAGMKAAMDGFFSLFPLAFRKFP